VFYNSTAVAAATAVCAAPLHAAATVLYGTVLMEEERARRDEGGTVGVTAPINTAMDDSSGRQKTRRQRRALVNNSSKRQEVCGLVAPSRGQRPRASSKVGRTDGRRIALSRS